jgi:hypothetical protein
LVITFSVTWTIPEGVGDTVAIHLLALLFGFGGYKLQLEGMKYYKMIKGTKPATN